MILCSCAVLTDEDLKSTITQIFDRDPYAVITPGRVFHALDKRMDCHGCRENLDQAIAAAVKEQIEAVAAADVPKKEA